jgi:hypothetical protein
MPRLQIVEEDGETVLAEFVLDDGTVIEVVTGVRLADDRLILYDFHVEGPGPKTLGLAGLYHAAKWVMEKYDVGCLEIHGFRRTTGLRLGHQPRPVVFRRRR